MIKISPEMAQWVKKVDTVELATFNPENGFASLPDHWHDLTFMVGEYSEAFEKSSYNQEDILRLLISGKMDEEAQRHIKQDDGFSFQTTILADGQYAKQLMDLVEKVGGWPKEPLDCVKLEQYLHTLGYCL